MVGQHGLNLAVSTITSHFGEIVAKVCGCLMRRGSLSLQELVRSTELSASQVKNCLLVLIQHNCAQAFSVPLPAGLRGVPRTVTLYMALFDNILHRTRLSKFLGIVRDDPDLSDVPEPRKSKSQCGSLLEGLLQHGRLTFDQLFVREISKQGNTITRDDLRADFNRLVHAHYVERCPRSEPFLLQNPDDKPASARRRGAKFVEETPTIEQQAIMTAALSDAERFSEITDIGADTIVDTKVTDHYLDVSVGDKRKYEAVEMDQEVQATITENDVLWRANFEKFINCLKKKVCVANVRSRLSLDAAIVLEAMIESSHKEKVKDKNSVTSSMDSILSGARKKKGDDSMTLEDLRIILEQLGCRLCTEETGALYTIDLKGIIEICQNDEVEALVLKRYGNDTYRIFRLLAKNGQPFETDNISDITFVGKKEAKEILYKLWKDDYLNMEKAISYATGQNQQFLWRVNKKALWELFLNDMYHAALNISLRIAHIVEQQKEVSLGKKELDLLNKSRWVLESSLLKIDDALVLFRDF